MTVSGHFWAAIIFILVPLQKGEFVLPIIAINHLEFIGINLIGILNHVEKN